MTVNELCDKLEEMKLLGYGDKKVVLGMYAPDGLFYPRDEIRSCHGLVTEKEDSAICGLSTSCS